MSLGISSQSEASEKKKFLEALRKRVVPNAQMGSSFIKSYGTRDVSYLYDQALAIMTFTHDKDKTRARSLLLSLEKLSQKNHALHFAYITEGYSAFAGDEVRVIHGATAWAVMAANYYQKQFHDKEFTPFAEKMLNYLETQKVSVLGGEAIRFAKDNLTTTSWNETQILALEHNIDAYSAFKIFHEMNPHPKFKETAQGIKKFIAAMWDSQSKHYWSGYNLDTKRINKDEIYLDNQTWTLLAVDSEDLTQEDANHALNKACESFYHVAQDNTQEKIYGFFDRKSSRAPAFDKFVWSEGTAGKLLAAKFTNPLEDYKCQSSVEKDFSHSFTQMKQADGGVSYATKTPNKDFTTDSSIAGTAWAYFYLAGLNPFKLIELGRVSPIKVGDKYKISHSMKLVKISND